MPPGPSDGAGAPKSYTGLAHGRYTFFVRAFNAGGPDPTPAKKSFKL